MKTSYKAIFTFLNFAVTILSSVGLVLAFISSRVSSIEFDWLPYMSLLAPLFVLMSFVMMLVNIIRFRPLALLPLVVLIVSFYNITSIINYPIKKEYVEQKRVLKIATYNVRLLQDSTSQNVADSILNFITNEKPQIIFMQEFVKAKKNFDLINATLKDYPYSNIQESKTAARMCLAIYSKYPIIETVDKFDLAKSTGYMRSDIVIKSDTVRVFNMHLKSNTITKEEREFLSNNEGLEERHYSEFKEAFVKFRENALLRAAQADSIAIEIEQSPYKDVIVCGDFNDVPFSYTFNKVKGTLNDTFAKKGSGYAYSYNLLRKLLKIDYILVSDSFEVVSYNSPLNTLSDHNPIFVELVRVD
ncbi:MAG: endonuclease/exonuclease/phosphatase family protein [Rikenellaceae bacterium]